MEEIKAPEFVPTNNKTKIFFAGTIDMGESEDWQANLKNELKDFDITIMNPRRDDWDSSWKQEIGNEIFNEQVTWELDCLEKSDVIVMYIDKDSKSPISLLELGLFKDKKMLVYCPDGFYRSGNIFITCARYNIPVFKDKKEFIEVLKKEIKTSEQELFEYIRG